MPLVTPCMFFTLQYGNDGLRCFWKVTSSFLFMPGNSSYIVILFFYRSDKRRPLLCITAQCFESSWPTRRADIRLFVFIHTLHISTPSFMLDDPRRHISKCMPRSKIYSSFSILKGHRKHMSCIWILRHFLISRRISYWWTNPLNHGLYWVVFRLFAYPARQRHI